MKFTVTEVLVSYIKEKRKEQNITVTSFAEKIGKSKSYITKFDNCEFKTLTVEAFNEIFFALSDNSEEKAYQLMDNYFMSLLENKYTDKYIDLWIDFSNYSHIIKKIEIPKELITYLKKTIKLSNLDLKEIIDTANLNLPVKDYPNFELTDFNEYVATPISINTVDDIKRQIYIKIKLEENNIIPILNGEISKCNYLTLLAIANTYYRITFSKSNTPKENLEKIAFTAARNLLFNFKFYTLEDYNSVQENEENLNKFINRLEKSSNTVKSTLGSYMSLITQIYEQDLFYTEGKIIGLRKNMEADAAFLIATMDLPFYKVKKLNTDNKKKLLNEISELIDKYASDEEYQEQIDLIYLK